MTTHTYDYTRANLPGFAYTNRDFNSIMRGMIEVIPGISTKWTDFNPSDQGIVILELLAFGLDNESYALDAEMGEAFVPTVQLRDNLFNLVGLVGYRPHGPVPGAMTLTVTLPESYEGGAHSAITIPRYWQARSSRRTDQMVATIDEAAIPPGGMTVDVAAVQGRVATAAFTSIGGSDQILELPDENACLPLPLVNGTEWQVVDSLVGQAADATVCEARFTWDDKIILIFGDNVEGKAPEAGWPIEVTYLITLGSAGNSFGSGIIDTALDALYDDGVNVGPQMLISNTTVTGGDDAETDRQIKRRAGRVFRTQGRMVSGNDYRSLVESVPGVERVLVRDVNTVGEAVWNNYLELYVVPCGGGEMGEDLLADITALINLRRPAATDVRVYSSGYVVVDVEVDVYRYASTSEATVIVDVEDALREYFSLDEDEGSTEHGQTVDPDELAAVVDRVDGVSYCEVVTPAADVLVDELAIAVLGTLTINMHIVGE